MHDKLLELFDGDIKLARQIEELYQEAGYRAEPRVTDATLYGLIWAKGHGYMTGEEWYSRLAKHINTYDWTQDEKDSILQAAFEVAEGLDNV